MAIPPIVKHIARILIGATFIASAVLKLIGIDAFEVYIFSSGVFGLPFSTILARLIISGEAILGFLLLLQFRYSLIKKITAAVLSVFSVYLIYLITQGSHENCQCFGTMIQLSPLESLFKNIALFILLAMAWNCKEWNITFKSNIALFAVTFLLLFPSLLLPPDFIMHYPDMSGDVMQIAEKRMQNNAVLQREEVLSGRKMVCMFSTHCSYCMHAAEKISIIAEKNHLDNQIVYIFTGTESDLPDFWEKSHSEKYHYFFLPMRDFFEIAGPSVPSIYLVNNGDITTHFHYRNIDENTIKQFFEQP